MRFHSVLDPRIFLSHHRVLLPVDEFFKSFSETLYPCVLCFHFDSVK